MGAENMGYTVRRVRFGAEQSNIDAELTGKTRPREIVMALALYDADSTRLESSTQAIAELLNVAHETTGEVVARSLRYAVIPNSAEALKQLKEGMRNDEERLMHLLVLGSPDEATLNQINTVLETQTKVARVCSPALWARVPRPRSLTPAHSKRCCCKQPNGHDHHLPPDAAMRGGRVRTRRERGSLDGGGGARHRERGAAVCAASGIAGAVSRQRQQRGRCARRGAELIVEGWKLHARLCCAPEAMKELPHEHFAALGGQLRVIEDATTFDFPAGPLVSLDGLLGIGAQGPMKPELQVLAREMNTLREHKHALTIAMDIPSGLDGDHGDASKDAVEADVTAVVAQIKAGLLEDGADHHVGRIALVPLIELSKCEGDPTTLALTPGVLRAWLPRRANDMHKGEAGRVGILAGSRGFLGAAELACRGAIRAGSRPCHAAGERGRLSAHRAACARGGDGDAGG
jgi:hypothetical protein